MKKAIALLVAGVILMGVTFLALIGNTIGIIGAFDAMNENTRVSTVAENISLSIYSTVVGIIAFLIGIVLLVISIIWIVKITKKSKECLTSGQMGDI